MEQLFIYIFIGLVFASILLSVMFRFFTASDNEESNFGGGVTNEIQGPIDPAPPEHLLWQDKQGGLLSAIAKRAPSAILTFVFVQIFTFVLSGYIATRNIERLAMAGAAMERGDFGSAVSALWPLGKEVSVEQWKIGRGKHSYLDEKELFNFSYVGKIGNKNLAIMDNLYRTQDHDPELKPGANSYDTVITGITAKNAIELCQEKYGANLVSSDEMAVARGHIFADKNIREYPNIPEWTRDVHKDDSDDYLVLYKDSGMLKKVQKKGYDSEENGLFVDSEDFENAGFRCSITWDDEE